MCVHLIMASYHWVGGDIIINHFTLAALFRIPTTLYAANVHELHTLDLTFPVNCLYTIPNQI